MTKIAEESKKLQAILFFSSSHKVFHPNIKRDLEAHVQNVNVTTCMDDITVNIKKDNTTTDEDNTHIIPYVSVLMLYFADNLTYTI